MVFPLAVRFLKVFSPPTSGANAIIHHLNKPLSVKDCLEKFQVNLDSFVPRVLFDHELHHRLPITLVRTHDQFPGLRREVDYVAETEDFAESCLSYEIIVDYRLFGQNR